MIIRLQKIQGTRRNGFGQNATSVAFCDIAVGLTPDQFDKALTDNKPSGYQEVGFNAGAPVDGLSEVVKDGVRYLCDSTGSSSVYLAFQITDNVRGVPTSIAPDHRLGQRYRRLA